jgi:hypothetical protein
MTRRMDDKEPEPEGGRAAERLRDFLRRRSIAGDEQPPQTADEEPHTDQRTAEDDSGR